MITADTFNLHDNAAIRSSTCTFRSAPCVSTIEKVSRDDAGGIVASADRLLIGIRVRFMEENPGFAIVIRAKRAFTLRASGSGKKIIVLHLAETPLKNDTQTFTVLRLRKILSSRNKALVVTVSKRVITSARARARVALTINR